MAVRLNETEMKDLMIAGLNGDVRAHKALLGKLSSGLRAYFKTRLARSRQGHSEAEDLVQEVLIAVHTRRHTYDPSQPFTPWVYAIARYKLLDHLRRTNGSTKNIPIEEAEELLARDDLVEIESTLDLTRLMNNVSPKVRRIIQYVKLEGLSVSEAAERCEMSESAVKVSVHRGLKALALIVNKGNRS